MWIGVKWLYIQGQIKSTCNKDDEANILTPLPGDCGNKRVCKYQNYPQKTAWSYPCEDGKVNTHTYSHTLRPKFCLKQKFCNEWPTTSKAVSSASSRVENFYTNKSPRSSNTIIPQVIYLLINHLLSHNSTK
jgi:hypothetical protein